MPYIDDLVQLGADAMTNLWDVIITPPSTVSLDPEPLRLRAQGFTPPNVSIPTYEVAYKTVTIPRPRTQVQVARNFGVTFRIDSNYEVYRVLTEWKSRFVIGSNGFASNAVPATDTGTIVVRAYQGDIIPSNGIESGVNEGEIVNTQVEWEFRNCWISDLTTPQYQVGEAGAVSVQCTWQFGAFTAPFEL